jgi:uncharacterized protein (TIGR03067 family)
MRAATLITLFVALGATAWGAPQDETAKDTAALKGKWEVVSSELEGKPATTNYRPGTVIVIDGDELYFTDGFAKSQPTKFKIDAKAKPRSLDIGADEGNRKVLKGIYALDRDSLKLCLSLTAERPKEFKTAPGDKNTLLVLKRQKP